MVCHNSVGIALSVGRLNPAGAVVAIQTRIFPVCINGHHVPAVTACSGANGFPFSPGAIFAQTSAITGDSKEWISAWPSVWAGGQLVG